MQENGTDNLGADKLGTLKAALAGTHRGRAGGIGLILLCLVVYLPGLFALPPVDRDEVRFAQASRQMFESAVFPAAQKDPARHGGGLVVPMVQDRPRLNKPPFIYWAQAASAALFTGGNPFRDAIWMYRLPSLFAAIAVVVMTRRLGTAMFDRAAGNLAAVFIAVCPVVAWEARQARADMVLLAWTMLAMLQLWRIYARDLSHLFGSTEGESERAPSGLKSAILFWIAIGGGIMTKGPITPIVAALTAVGISIGSRRWRWLLDLKPWFGLPIVALMVGPWVYAVARHIGFDKYWDTIYRETIGRSTDAAEGHWGPPGYHFVLMPLLLWPASVLTGLGLIVAARLALTRSSAATPDSGSVRDKVRAAIAAQTGHPAYLYLLSWIIPAWLIFEIVSTKLPHYTMPMYPALAILSARAILAADAKALPGVESRWTRTGFILWLILGAGIVFGAAGLVVTRLVAFPASIAGMIGLILLGFVGTLLMLQALGASWRAILGRRFARAAISGVLVMLLLWVVMVPAALPRLMGFTTSIMTELDRIDPGAARPIAAVGYHEDSLIFMTRGRLDRLDAASIPTWFAQHPRGILVRERGQAATGTSLKEVGSASGFNYSKGRTQHVAIEEIAP